MLDPDTELRGLRRAALRIGMPPEAVVLPVHRQLPGGDVELAYIEWPAPDGAPTVAFLHGGRLTARTWDLVCLALHDTYRCVALDQRGHGDSGWSAERRYGVQDRVGDLDRLLAHLAPSRYALVGHSLGGLVALSFASRHPAGLASLILVDSGPSASSAPLPQRIRGLATRTAGARTLDEFISEALTFSPRRDPESLRYSLLHNLRDIGGGKFAWKYDPEPYAPAGDPARYADQDRAWESAGDVSAPTLLAHGGKSELLTADAAAALVRSLAHGELITFPGAGHSVQGDRPRELADALREFLGRTLGPPER